LREGTPADAERREHRHHGAFRCSVAVPAGVARASARVRSRRGGPSGGGRVGRACCASRRASTPTLDGRQVALVVSFRIIPRKNTPRETFRINSPTRSLEELSKRADDRARRKDATRAECSFTTTDDER
jgi:hypothetical protein